MFFCTDELKAEGGWQPRTPFNGHFLLIESDFAYRLHSRKLTDMGPKKKMLWKRNPVQFSGPFFMETVCNP